MSVLRRVATFLIPSLADSTVPERHFHPEDDEHLQWMETQRMESEQMVQQWRRDSSATIDQMVADVVSRNRREGSNARMD